MLFALWRSFRRCRDRCSRRWRSRVCGHRSRAASRATNSRRRRGKPDETRPGGDASSRDRARSRRRRCDRNRLRRRTRAAARAAAATTPLLDRIGEVRRALATDIGIVLPGVRLRDDLTRDADSYAIRVRDAIAVVGSLRARTARLPSPTKALADVGGEAVREPVYGLPARGSSRRARERRTARGSARLRSDFDSRLAPRRGRAPVRSRAFRTPRVATLLEHLARDSAGAREGDRRRQAFPSRWCTAPSSLLLREGVWPRDPLVALEAMIDAARRANRASCRSRAPAIVRGDRACVAAMKR